MENTLFFGDNLDVLRAKFGPETVDLVYLDPPFNSNANYNVLFRDAAGEAVEAQTGVFRDTWVWGPSAAEAYDQIMSAGGDAALVARGLHDWLGSSAMMAYVSMMAVRLLELSAVMKPTASLYLHCDPTASHYLKLVLDAIFGVQSYRNEIVWKRTPFSGSSKARAKQLPRSHDTLLFFTKSDKWIWNPPVVPYAEKYLARFKWDDGDGRGPYRKTLLKTYSDATFERLKADNRLIEPVRPGAKYSYKQYLSESSGTRQIDDIWIDINALNPVAKERLGYPTQKPVALLERIIAQSSNEGDLVLDPFCGCGTTVDAAENIGRRWAGIDVTHYAITLIEERMQRNHAGVSCTIYGRPTDLAGAYELARRDKYQFQWWAAWLLGAHTYREHRGADRGIDGNIFFKNGPYGNGRIIISVKGGENVGVQMVRDLRGVIEREDAEMGILITLTDPTGPMVSECASAGFATRSAHGRLPRLQVVTIAELLDERLPQLPPIPRPQRGARTPPRKRKADQFELLLPLEGDKSVVKKGDFIDPRYLNFG